MRIVGKAHRGPRPMLLLGGAIFSLALASSGAWAAESELNGAGLSLFWVLPFAGILASLALLPSLTPHLWHTRCGLVALFWALVFIIPFAIRFGAGLAAHELLHMLLLEYIPFIILIGALFAIAGGIVVGGALRGTPMLNLALLLIGTIMASFIGTTGASMILIRPLIRANIGRRHRAHIVVFFIFLVSNIGGGLTPLGDPPLFLGYLQGVDFFWPLLNLWKQTLVVSGLVLAVFFALDVYLYRGERRSEPDRGPDSAFYLGGYINIPIFLLLLVTVAASGSLGFLGQVTVFGIGVTWANLMRDGILIVLALASLILTPRAHREKNEFNWGPVAEVAKLFAAIFVTIIPAIAMLRAGQAGAFAPILSLLGGTETPNNAAYFWLTGGLSAFLDNAPTYLVFFNAAGGDAARLMGPLASTLAAISAGAVFMGALTYIGNAPNFMVRAIAEDQGISMPSFFGYMAWSMAVLIPSFGLVTWIFFL